jgi:hypothetical protein
MVPAWAVLAVGLGVMRSVGGDDAGAACASGLPPLLSPPVVMRCNDDYECVGQVFGCKCPGSGFITPSCSPLCLGCRRQGQCMCKQQPTPAHPSTQPPGDVTLVSSGVTTETFVEHEGSSHVLVECPVCQANYLGQLGSNDPQVCGAPFPSALACSPFPATSVIRCEAPARLSLSRLPVLRAHRARASGMQNAARRSRGAARSRREGGARRALSRHGRRALATPVGHWDTPMRGTPTLLCLLSTRNGARALSEPA